MKARLTQTQINQIFRVQEICDKHRRKANDEECKTYIDNEEIDRERFINILDCISASIEELAEILYN